MNSRLLRVWPSQTAALNVPVGFPNRALKSVIRAMAYCLGGCLQNGKRRGRQASWVGFPRRKRFQDGWVHSNTLKSMFLVVAVGCLAELWEIQLYNYLSKIRQFVASSDFSIVESLPDSTLWRSSNAQRAHTHTIRCIVSRYKRSARYDMVRFSHSCR